MEWQREREREREPWHICNMWLCTKRRWKGTHKYWEWILEWVNIGRITIAGDFNGKVGAKDETKPNIP